MHGENVRRIPLGASFGYPYHRNGTKTLLDATLLNIAKYLKFDLNSHLLFSAYISVKIYFCHHQ